MIRRGSIFFIGVAFVYACNPSSETADANEVLIVEDGVDTVDHVVDGDSQQYTSDDDI